jgi:NADPH2:quinone reductase
LGLAAIQIGKALGLIAIVTANSVKRRSVCKEYGADLVLDSEADWIEAVLYFTKKSGVEIVLDPIGMLEESLKCIAWNGRIVVIGFAAGRIEKLFINRALLEPVRKV